MECCLEEALEIINRLKIHLTEEIFSAHFKLDVAFCQAA